MYFYSNNELIDYDLGDTLTSPIRAEFLVSDDLNETLEVTIEFADDEIEDYILPFVATIDNKHYYSFPQKLIKSVDNTIPGVDEETPTPTITPSLSECVSSPVTITVESEHISSGNSVYKYITSDSSGAGGLFGCINAERGSTLTILVDGDEPNLVSHPLTITNYNDQGQAMAPVDGVIKTDLTEGPTEDHTYSLTWVIPCDETIDMYQYQCEEHAGMRGTINVFGECEHTPTPTFFEEEPLGEYIYDSMEAVSIIGGDNEGQSIVGYNDRVLTTFQGVNGVTGLTLENNIVTLTEKGRYYIKARTSASKSESTYTAIKFLSGDYANEEFLGPRRYARQTQGQMAICECSIVVDITQTTTFKIQTKVQFADVKGLTAGESNLFVQKLASADGGGDNSSTTPQFCNVAGLATSQTISHNTRTKINFDGDLTTGSQSWRTYNAELGINVIEPSEAGYYNVNGAVWIGSTGSTAESMTDVQYAFIQLVKYNKTTKIATPVVYDYRGKSNGGGWIHLQPHITVDNVYLETDDILYIEADLWKSGNNTVQQKFGDNSKQTYFQVEKSNAISSSSNNSSGGGSSTSNVVSAIIEGDGTITSSSDDWIESVVVANGAMTINFVSNYFTQAPSIATSIDHQDHASHMNIEHNALTKDKVVIVQRGMTNSDYTTLGQFTIIAQHQDRISGSSSSNSNIVTGNYTGNGTDSQTIDLGFRPAIVHVKCTSAPYYGEMTQIDGLEGTSLRSYHTVNHSDDGYNIEITNTGFIAKGKENNSTFNHSGSEYYYYASGATTSGSSSSGVSNSAILPSSSILQKVYKDGGTKSDVADVGTEIISVEITPKSADSILLCTFNANYQEKDQSAQQAQFHINDVPFGGKLYCLSQDSMVREMVSLISKTTIDDLSKKTISVKIVYDEQEPTNFGSTFITVEEISTTDYVLGSSSSGGSSGNGAIGNNSEIIEASNFAETLPDMIVVKNSLNQPVLGRFFEFSGTETSDLIKYTFHEYLGHSRMAYFKNDSTGSNAIFNEKFTEENASFYDNATSLQDVIDSGNAIYYGGGFSSSGGSSSTASSVTIPDSCYAFIKEDGTITRKSDNWDEYVQEVQILSTNPNGYYRILYKSDVFTTAPIVIATADHKDNVGQPHVLAQTQAMNTTQADIVIGDANGLQTPSQFNVVLYSPQIKSNISLISSTGDSSTSESDILANGTMMVSSQISSLENSIGISSVARTALGTFKFTLTTPIQDAEYNVFANTIGSSISVAFVMSKTANDFTIETRRIDHANNKSIADVDANLQFVVIAK